MPQAMKGAFLVALIILALLSSDVVAGPRPQEWIYGETSVSGLSMEEKARLCGVAEGWTPPATMRLYAQYTYPSKLDWRDRYGGDFTTGVKDQGSCGSCVAFAVVASIESRLEVHRIAPDLNPDLSESHPFFCGCGDCCQRGWWNYHALDYIVANGLCDEGCFPYIDRDVPCEPCPEWQGRTIHLTHWAGVEGMDEMKQAIADGGPISVVMEVFWDFFWYKGGVYCPGKSIPVFVGLHAVEIVGYNDEEGYWIGKNSWGPGWGEDGWFRIGYYYEGNPNNQHCGIRPYGYVPFVDARPPALDYKVYFPMINRGRAEEQR